MANNGSANGAANRQHDGKSNKFTNAGAAAGGFVGAMAGSFVPPVNLTVNNNRGGGNGRRVNSESMLPAPDFTSPADVRNYCNALRALMVGISFEVAMGAEIMKGVLSTVPDPEGRIGGSKIRAWRVSRKLTKSADSAAAAAKNAAACYALFQQEYMEEINRVKHRARKPAAPRMDWARQ